MTITLTDFRSLKKIIVHDSESTSMNGMLAMARHVPAGGGSWILRIYGASWIDTMTNPQKLSQQKRMRIKPGTHAYLKAVKSKPEAMEHMKALAKLAAGTLPAVTKR